MVRAGFFGTCQVRFVTRHTGYYLRLYRHVCVYYFYFYIEIYLHRVSVVSVKGFLSQSCSLSKHFLTEPCSVYMSCSTIQCRVPVLLTPLNSSFRRTGSQKFLVINSYYFRFFRLHFDCIFCRTNF